MDHVQTRPVAVDPHRLRQVAIQLASPSGFRVEEEAGSVVALRGAGLNSTRQDALCGVSFLRWKSDGRSVTLEADLGATRRMVKFIRYFPPCLNVGLILFLGVIFYFSLPLGTRPMLAAILAVLAIGNSVLWVFLGAVMARSVENRTQQALDSYLTNAIAMCSERAL